MGTRDCITQMVEIYLAKRIMMNKHECTWVPQTLLDTITRIECWRLPLKSSFLSDIFCNNCKFVCYLC